MAERLMRPERASPEVSSTDVGFDDGFIGFASAPELVTTTTPPTPESPPPATASIEATPPTGARELFLTRIHNFRDWMRQEFSATGVFILDGQGGVIFDESGHGRLHFHARNLALATRRPGISAGSVHLKISADATLEVIPVETATVRLVLGAVVPQALAPVTVFAVMEALAKVATPPA